MFKPEERKIRVTRGISIFLAAKEAGVDIRSECDGKGSCGKCKITIKDHKAVNKVSEIEKKHFSPSEINSGFRLACQTTIFQNTKVTIPHESRIGLRKIQIKGLERPVKLDLALKKYNLTLPKPTLSDFRPDLERIFEELSNIINIRGLEIDYTALKKLPDILRNANWNITITIWKDRKIIAIEPGETTKELFGLALDIGTSKIVGYIVDLTTGKTIGIGSVKNPQAIHGEDIMSRIRFATVEDNGLITLQRSAIAGINHVLHEACIKAGIHPSHVYEATVVGNTAMHHFFLAIQPKYMALSPFTPVIKKTISVKASELNIGINSNGVINVLPVIAGFVGSDAVADALATGIHESNELSLLIDIGTNTEVFVGNTEDVLCCSCASGPAFEGAHIKHGIKAETGAIEKITIEPDSFEVKYKTVENAKPIGLCGSSIVDILAEMLKCGIINFQGRFNSKIETPRIRIPNGEKEFVLVWGTETGTGKDIVFTQKDVDEVQLAKAAIFAGCSILIKRKNLEKEHLTRILLAGAFGNFINPENAKIIGLIPDIPTERINFVGNTAVTGAKMALLSMEVMDTADVISNKIRYLELAADPDFAREFAYAWYLPHKDLERFPSISSLLNGIHKN